MKKFLICFILVSLPLITMGSCLLSTKEYSCRSTTINDFIKSFYQNSSEYISSPFTIIIEDSTFDEVDYIPNLPRRTQVVNTIQLSLKNSSIETISENFFEEFYDLQYLDLSYNRLNNVLFVHQLPTSIKRLSLNNNNISHLDDVFNRLQRLNHLDVSGNRIAMIDFHTVFGVEFLNFSHNLIESLIPSKKLTTESLDLSYNKIVTFNEEELFHAFTSLDISHNPLKLVTLANGEKKKLRVCGNNVSQILANDWLFVDILDLSSTNISLETNIVVRQQLILRNNKIGLFYKSTLNILKNIPKFSPYQLTVDMSNSFITDISSRRFERFFVKLLNLSHNNIILLRNKVFFQSSIEVLDLSNSNIEAIQNSAFQSLQTSVISLKGNKLNYTKDIFNEVQVNLLDLSFNKFMILANYSFLGAHALVSLNFEHCLIEKVEPEAFSGLDNLRNLSLAYNKLFILEANSFVNLQVLVLDLKGNKIDTIRGKAFNNISNLKSLELSNLALRNIEPYAFNNLIDVEMVDLRYNNISIIPHFLFVGMDNLGTVLLEGNKITTLNHFLSRLKLHTLTLTFKGIMKPNQISNLNIKYLRLKDSEIDMLDSNCFAGLYNLLELHFNSSYVYPETGALNNLFSLKSLDSRSLFKHIKIIKKETFRDLRSMKYLDLSRLSIQLLETEAFAGMVRLETLLLNDNKLGELREGTFVGLEYLKFLDLSSCDIDNYNDKSFTGLRSLQILRLDHNNLMNITSELLFGDLRALLDLHLEYNNISFLHNKSFNSINNLLRLHLHNNNLKDIPVGIFQYLPKLKTLNLSKNIIELLKTGALSNLISLEVLDLSDNRLVNLDYVDIFFSLRQLEVVRFDGNHLKEFDFKRFLTNLRKIRYVGLSHNKWKCDTLSYIIENLNNRSIDYKPQKPVYEDDNVDGVGCIDICKFVYCSNDNVEQTLHYY